MPRYITNLHQLDGRDPAGCANWATRPWWTVWGSRRSREFWSHGSIRRSRDRASASAPGRSAHDALRQARGYSARNAGIPMRSSTYFRRALQRSVRSPWAMNAPIMALHTRTASSGGTITPVGRAKSWWPRDAAQTELKIHPGRSAGCTPGQRDVVGISSTAARPPPSNAILNLRGRPYSSLHRRPAKSSRRQFQLRLRAASNLQAEGV